MPSLYQILNVPREATSEEIKKSYQLLSDLYSPTKNPGHEGEFKKIKEAFEILIDPKKRADYDGLNHLDASELINKGEQDINIAHLICDDESLLQKVGTMAQQAEILYLIGLRYQRYYTADCNDIARYYFHKAAVKDHGKALDALISLLREDGKYKYHVTQLKLAIIFANAKGQFYDEANAKFWFCRAASHGSIEAAFHLIIYLQQDIHLRLSTSNSLTMDVTGLDCYKSIAESMRKLVDITDIQNFIFCLLCLFYISSLSGIDERANKYTNNFAGQIQTKLDVDVLFWDENLRRVGGFNAFTLNNGNENSISKISKAEIEAFYPRIHILLDIMRLPISFLRIRMDVFNELITAYRSCQIHEFIRKVILDIVPRYKFKIKQLNEIADQERELNKILLLLDDNNKVLMDNIKLSQDRNDHDKAAIYIQRSCAVQSLLSDLSKVCTRYYTQDFSHPDNYPESTNFRCELHGIIACHLSDRKSGLTRLDNWLASDVSMFDASMSLMFSPHHIPQGEFVYNKNIPNSTVNLIKGNITIALDKLLGSVPKELSRDKEIVGAKLIEMMELNESFSRRT